MSAVLLGLGAWFVIAFIAAPLIGRRLRRQQPPNHCKHTNTPGGH